MGNALRMECWSTEEMVEIRESGESPGAVAPDVTLRFLDDPRSEANAFIARGEPETRPQNEAEL